MAETARLLRVLIVEDEFLLADEMRSALQESGAVVVGPAGNVQAALNLIARSELDVAVLDVNLRGETVVPVARELLARAIPFAFVTGYDIAAIDGSLAQAAQFEKPVNLAALTRWVWGFSSDDPHASSGTRG
ncbi:response regulator [Paracoccus sp. CPCC 101403]|uniref:Response regulator n=2 Tax=Paracoccus broussonetiae TaxID=3075834 RepID=A0ABU3EKL4_9RHOB|nr:response regulator [Paracoccus sp. CPCC 101403]MDT1064763.1 response regulator [Paracoccus sp. CPCC 101403]